MGLLVYWFGGMVELVLIWEEIVYVVFDGELVVIVDGVEIVLGWFDSVYFVKGEL